MDGTGAVRRIESVVRDKVLVVAAPTLIAEIVPKGSIAIDGISLTVVDVSSADGTFSVHVIPHTWSQTALSALAAGAHVNLETDLIGKYVRTMAASTASAPQVTWEKLRDAGFGA